ncbi:MAG: antitoxin [Proteobacteria bacterium]|nr:antitoxin [Pseudomonadota bacterium]
MYKIAKLFKNGRSQALRIPKEFRFKGDEVFIFREGNRVVISETAPGWDEFFGQKSAFGTDYLSERPNEPPPEREIF